MITEEWTMYEDEDQQEREDARLGWCSVDWKASPEELLEAFDAQLKPYNLQVVRAEDDGGDEYGWRIDRILR